MTVNAGNCFCIDVGSKFTGLGLFAFGISQQSFIFTGADLGDQSKPFPHFKLFQVHSNEL